MQSYRNLLKIVYYLIKTFVKSDFYATFASFMKRAITKYWNLYLSILVGIGVFMFWYVAYSHALSYQEQYQLFLWTGDYFAERVSVPGGLADWLGEFIVQFYYVEWLGALLLALLYVALQRLTARLLPQKWGVLSLVPVLMLWWCRRCKH